MTTSSLGEFKADWGNLVISTRKYRGEKYRGGAVSWYNHLGNPSVSIYSS